MQLDFINDIPFIAQRMYYRVLFSAVNVPNEVKLELLQQLREQYHLPIEEEQEEISTS
jgi:hypothetical protein